MSRTSGLGNRGPAALRNTISKAQIGKMENTGPRTRQSLVQVKLWKTMNGGRTADDSFWHFHPWLWIQLGAFLGRQSLPSNMIQI